MQLERKGTHLEPSNRFRSRGAGTKQRILFLTHLPPPIHGVSIINQLVIGAIVEQGVFETRVVGIRPRSKLDSLGTLSIRKLFYSVGLFFRLALKLTTFRPHFVYFSLTPLPPVLYRDAILVGLSKLFRAKCIFHLHRQGIGQAINKSAGVKKWLRFVFKNATVAHLTPYLAQKELIEACQLNAEQVRVIGNPLVVPPKRVSIPRCDKQLLLFSNLIPHKGLGPLVEGMAEVLKHEPQATLIIAGGVVDSSYILQLQTTIDSLGLSNSVRLLTNPSKSESAELFSQSTLFVLPSLDDCFPLVINEALSYGLPVITSKVGGLDTVFAPNEGLIFLERVDAESIGKAALWALAHASELLHNVKKGMARVDKLTQEFPKAVVTLFNK